MLTHTYYAQTYAGIIYLPLHTNWRVWHNNTLFRGMDTSTNPNNNFTWNRTQPLIDGGIILIAPTIIKSWCSVSAHYCNHMHDLDCILEIYAIFLLLAKSLSCRFFVHNVIEDCFGKLYSNGKIIIIYIPL